MERAECPHQLARQKKLALTLALALALTLT